MTWLYFVLYCLAVVCWIAATPKSPPLGIDSGRWIALGLVFFGLVPALLYARALGL